MSGRVLRDLSTDDVVANPARSDLPELLFTPPKIGINGVLKHQLLEAMFVDPDNMPLEDGPPHQTSMIKSGFGTGAKRTGWKRPIPRGQGRKKAFSKDTPKHVQYHPSYKDKEVAPDTHTKARRRPRQVRLTPSDEAILAARRIVLRPATKMQLAGPTFAPFILVTSSGFDRLWTCDLSLAAIEVILGRQNHA